MAEFMLAAALLSGLAALRRDSPWAKTAKTDTNVPTDAPPTIEPTKTRQFQGAARTTMQAGRYYRQNGELKVADWGFPANDVSKMSVWAIDPYLEAVAMTIRPMPDVADLK